MASRYGGASTGGGSRYSSVKTSTGSPYTKIKTGNRAKKDDGFSLGGLAGNFLSGARDAVVGLGPGLYETARASGDIFNYVSSAGKDPLDDRTKRFGKALIDSYKETYGRGWRGLYENPFNVFLDATLVASVGASTAVKAGVVPSRSVLRTSAAAGKTGPLEIGREAVVKEFSTRPLRRVSQAAADKALKLLPENTKYGEYGRAAKITAQQAHRIDAVNKNLNLRQMRAVEKLRDPVDQIAATARAMFGGDEKVFDTWASRGGELGAQLTKKGVRERYLAPSKQINGAVDAMRKLGERGERLLGVRGAVADARKFMMIRLARGAEWVDDLSDYAHLDDGRVIQFMRNREGDFIRNSKGKLKYKVVRNDPMKKTWETTGTGKSYVTRYIDDADIRPLDNIDALPKPHQEGIGKMLVGGGTVEELTKEFAGRMPAFVSHVAPAQRRGWFAGVKGGTTRPLKVPEAKQNLGRLAERGFIRMDPRVTINSFARAVTYNTRLRKFNELLKQSRRMTPEEAQAVLQAEPGRWQILNIQRNQANPAWLRGAEEMGDWLDNVGSLDKWLDDLGVEQLGKALGDFGDDALRAGQEVNGMVHVVPKAAVREIGGEFTRMNNVVYKLQKGPVAAWRALVLNLRPAWLVNNVLGNTLMYLIDDASPASLAALGRSIKANLRKGDRLNATLFDDITVRGQMDIVDKWFSNIETFIGSQRPTGVARHLDRLPGGYAVRRGAGLLADFDRGFERILREAKVQSILQKHPKLKKFTKGVRKDTPEYWRAIDEGFERNPALADSIAKQVNEALGDFMGMSGFERSVMRTIFPFYAWFRAITGVTLKLPLNHPLKANLLGHINQAAAEITIEELGLAGKHYPGFAVGMIPVGELKLDGRGITRLPIISTSATNPYATTSDLGEFFAALFSADMGAAGRQLPGASPFIMAPLQAISGQNWATGSPLHKNWENRFGAPGNIAGQIVRNVPQWRLYEGVTGTRYQGTKKRPTLYDQNLEQLLMRYFGYPRADVSTKRLEDIP